MNNLARPGTSKSAKIAPAVDVRIGEVAENKYSSWTFKDKYRLMFTRGMQELFTYTNGVRHDFTPMLVAYDRGNSSNSNVLGGEGKGPILNGLVDICPAMKAEIINTLVAFDMGRQSRKREDSKDNGASSESAKCEE